MGAVKRSDKAAAPLALCDERDRIDELCEAMHDGIRAMLKAAADKANGEGLTLTREQAATLRAYDNLLQRKMYAVKTDAEIAHMDELTQADLQAMWKKISFYTGRALRHPIEQIGPRLRKLLSDDPLFERVKLAQKHIDKIVQVACGPSRESLDRWAELVESGVVMDRDMPAPGEGVTDEGH